MSKNIILMSSNQYLKEAVSYIDKSINHGRLNCRGSILVIDVENYSDYDSTIIETQICYIFIITSRIEFTRIFDQIEFKVPVQYIVGKCQIDTFNRLLSVALIDLERRVACTKCYTSTNADFLSKRDQEMLDLHLNGTAMEEIARLFDISFKTALTYRSMATTKAFRTMGVNALKIWKAKAELAFFLKTQAKSLDKEKLNDMCINCPRLKNREN